MDWKTFVDQNASALIGSVSGMIGVAIGAMISFLLQLQQRRWTLDDQRRQWKREKLTEHIAPIREWVIVTLRMLRTYELLADEKFARSAFADDFSQEIQEQYKSHLSYDSTLYPHVIALGDDEIVKYCEMFRESYFLFIDVARKKDKGKIQDIQRALVMASTLINRRIDALFDKTFVIGKSGK
ncbi:MAG: hypothetical protein HY869_10675 [Chloroflexi bacterium]|nr:hypothetical protein [Chloroflexota bacterium]